MKSKSLKLNAPAYKHPANYFVRVIEKVKYSVVSIEAKKRDHSVRPTGRFPFSFWLPEDDQPKIAGMGTGFIIHPSGYTLTSAHVIQNAQEITVRLFNGEERKAALVWKDSSRDLAVIKIPTNTPLPPIRIGSSKKSKVGELVLSIGNPMGLDHTITTGIISAKDRHILLADNVYGDILQTDCAINPGNSGGPLININGEVIGMNAFIAKNNQGLGFSIGMDSIKEVIQKYLAR